MKKRQKKSRTSLHKFECIEFRYNQFYRRYEKIWDTYRTRKFAVGYFATQPGTHILANAQKCTP